MHRRAVVTTPYDAADLLLLTLDTLSEEVVPLLELEGPALELCVSVPLRLLFPRLFLRVCSPGLTTEVVRTAGSHLLDLFQRFLHLSVLAEGEVAMCELASGSTIVSRGEVNIRLGGCLSADSLTCTLVEVVWQGKLCAIFGFSVPGLTGNCCV